jgi:hypothetical protein
MGGSEMEKITLEKVLAKEIEQILSKYEIEEEELTFEIEQIIN